MPSTPGLLLFDPLAWFGSTTTLALDASGKKTGAVYVAPKAGNISHVGVSVASVTSPPVCAARVETVNSSRVPSGTLFTGGATATFTPSAGFTWVALGSPAVVSAGDRVAAVVEYSSGTVGASNSVTFNERVGVTVRLPYAATNAGAGWSTSGNVPCAALKYDDGTIIPGGAPVASITSSTYSSASSPNERATVFTAPAGCALAGARFFGQLVTTATGSASVDLYAGTSTTPLASAPVPADAASALASTAPFTVDFPAPVTLTAGQVYRLGLRATGAGSVLLFRYTFGSATERDAVMGDCTSDTRAGGAWLGEQSLVSEMLLPRLASVTASGGGAIGGGGLGGGLQ